MSVRVDAAIVGPVPVLDGVGSARRSIVRLQVPVGPSRVNLAAAGFDAAVDKRRLAMVGGASDTELVAVEAAPARVVTVGAPVPLL